MKLILAPMEGLVDSYLRQVLTSLGGYDWCVSEFIRVTDKLLPSKVFYRMVPELRNGGLTASATPVYVQLMGNQATVVADNGARVVELGAPGVDLNFGCPSPTVNRSGAGAILLNDPELIHRIVLELRRSVSSEIPVSAKIRLGYDDTDNTLEIVRGIEAAGASMITVHARTRADRYTAPARWEWLAKIREVIDIPVIANGDITDLRSLQRCELISGCDHFMIGRAAARHPYLAQQIRQQQAGLPPKELVWREHLELLLQLSVLMAEVENQPGAASRIKQWLRMLTKGSAAIREEAQELFERIKGERDLEPITQILRDS
jgi:tRNA-dihydrouridine synthase C